MPKAEAAFSRANAVYDTTIGWRFVNRKMKDSYGVDSMPETADNVAEDHDVSRADQDAFAASLCGFNRVGISGKHFAADLPGFAGPDVRTLSDHPARFDDRPTPHRARTIAGHLQIACQLAPIPR